MDLEEQVILVNTLDEAIGSMEKIEAHKKGLLHRAFSVFIFNEKGELLLQQRAFDKYHSGGLWTNTCCSHQRPNEDTITAAKRRLNEEMGFSSELSEISSFIYSVQLTGEISEHEFDHILVGIYNGKVNPNPEEVNDYKWVNFDELEKDCISNPENFTFWLRYILEKFPSIFNAYTTSK